MEVKGSWVICVSTWTNVDGQPTTRILVGDGVEAPVERWRRVEPGVADVLAHIGAELATLAR